MYKRCYGYDVKIHDGTSNLLVETSNYESLEDAMAFALAAEDRFNVTIVAWDNLKGQWHPLMKRLCLYRSPEGYDMPFRRPTLVPLFGRANG